MVLTIGPYFIKKFPHHFMGVGIEEMKSKYNKIFEKINIYQKNHRHIYNIFYLQYNRIDEQKFLP